MKFFHLSDLHLGKTVHEFSMLEDQEHILRAILEAADLRKPDAVLICGDVYDRSVAPSDAMTLFDNFLVELAGRNIKVFVISGNHDSAERLAFASRLLSGSGVYIAPAYDGRVARVTLSDGYGEIDIFLLPFIRPNMVRRHFPDSKIETWSDAVRAALSGVVLTPGRRSVLLAHQFVTGGETSESEEFAVGGADNVDAAVFQGFDYVALGHLHKAQHLGAGTLRYSGAPLKYSFSEAGQDKSICEVELKEKGRVHISALPLSPLRDLKVIRGTYMELTDKAFYGALAPEDYYKVVLTNDEDQPDALRKLRLIYKRLMRLEYDNLRTRTQGFLSPAGDIRELSPLELFEKLYREQNGRSLSREQKAYLSGKIEAIWEAEE